MTRAARDSLSRQSDGRLLELAATATIVTRTKRLARDLRGRAAELRSLAGTPTAETPDVVAVDEWIERLWERSSPSELLLASGAERLLWERVIARDASAADDGGRRGALPAELLDVGLLAAEAAAAWRLVHYWGEPPRKGAFTPECEAFARWSSAFAEHLRASDLCTAAELPRRVASAVATGVVAPPPRVVLAGFERLEPAHRDLFDRLREHGSAVEDLDEGAAREPGRLTVTRYRDARHEVRSVARRVRTDLERAPMARIGIVAADLSEYRRLLERELGSELDPATVLPSGERRARAFDLAGAPALSAHPVVAHALDLLALQASDNRFDLVSRILLSPYPREADEGGGDEGDARAAAEVELRARNLLAVDLDRLAGIARSSGATRLADRLDALGGLLDDGGARRGPAEWVRLFVRRLQAMGWPGGDLDHDGDEGVAFSRWRDVLDELSSLDAVAPSLDAEQAGERLRLLCSERPVQAPSKGLDVQVMGLLDAAGLEFDRVYAVGMTAARFPAPARPHPLLPAAWQRQHELPLASPTAELAFARKVWERLMRAAPEVEASWPQRSAGDEETIASPLLGGHRPGRVVEPAAVDDPWYLPAAAARAEACEPAAAPDAPPAVVRGGGTGLLTDHALCPFKSFASRRLAVERLVEPAPEPTPLTRGNVVHEVLGELWKEIETSEALRVLPAATLRERVREQVEQVLRRLHDVRAVGGRRRIRLQATAAAALADWATDLVTAWLAYERESRRDDWKVVAVEESAALALDAGDGGSPVVLERLRIDRIDRLDDGTALVVDYKTSARQSSSRLWRGERPADAQLPIYALALLEAGERVGGVAFANLKARDDVGFIGLADTALAPRLGPPRKTKGEGDWPGLAAEIDGWRAVLAGLARGYAGGDARVEPLRSPSPCDFCQRHPLCRVFEREDAGVAGDDTDGDADGTGEPW